MTKNSKLGLSAIVALALMFTTSVNVVAQEKVNGSKDTDKLEMNVAGEVVQRGESSLVQFAQSNKETITEGVLVRKELGLTNNVLQNIVWYYHGNNSSAQITDVNFWKPETNLDGKPHPDCELGEEIPCSLEGPPDPSLFQSQLTSSGVGGIMEDASSLRLWE